MKYEGSLINDEISEVALQYGQDLVGLREDGVLITLLDNQTEISEWPTIGNTVIQNNN